MHKYRDSVMGKSRQDTADLNRYYTRTDEKIKREADDYVNKFSVNNSPRDERLSFRASSIGAQGSSQGKFNRMNNTTMFGGNKFHSGLSNYNYTTKTHIG